MLESTCPPVDRADYDRGVNARRAALVVAVASMVLSGCSGGGDRATQTSAAGPVRNYIEAARRLVATPGRLISLLPTVATATELPEPQEARLIVDDARQRLRELRAIPIGDARLRRQRARLADEVARLLPDMERITDDIARRDRNAIDRDGRAFLGRVRRLPSAIRAS